MSIASEINRLQEAKACMKAAIENKGVSVGSNVKLDDYDDCINAISSGGGGPASGMKIDFLMVAGGGSGGRGLCYGCGGGGGAGEVLECCNRILKKMEYPIVIGLGGKGDPNGSNPGGDTSAFGYTVLGGGAGGPSNGIGAGGNGGCGGNGGGAGGSSYSTCGGRCGMPGCAGLSIGYWVGNDGLGNAETRTGCGGGGAGGMPSGYIGGPGITSSITGTSTEYAKGGNSCSGYVTVTGCGSGGNGRYGGFNSFCCGSPGCAGIVVVSYTPQSGYILTGGNCCYSCNGKCIHIFTSDGTLTVS